MFAGCLCVCQDFYRYHRRLRTSNKYYNNNLRRWFLWRLIGGGCVACCNFNAASDRCYRIRYRQRRYFNGWHPLPPPLSTAATTADQPGLQTTAAPSTPIHRRSTEPQPSTTDQLDRRCRFKSLQPQLLTADPNNWTVATLQTATPSTPIHHRSTEPTLSTADTNRKHYRCRHPFHSIVFLLKDVRTRDTRTTCGDQRRSRRRRVVQPAK